MSVNKSYLVNFIVHFIAFLRLPLVFYLDTIELFYDDCRLLVTLCVCVSVCLSVFLCVYAHLLVFTLAQTSLSLQ